MRPKLRTEHLAHVFACIGEIKEAAQTGCDVASEMFHKEPAEGGGNHLDDEIETLFSRILADVYNVSDLIWKHDPLCAALGESFGKDKNRILQFRDMCKRAKEAKRAKHGD